ncbi:DUF397 domain-containing protein [Kitasatospora sp. NBC_01287]|uniref:DUF397 domain-containing protein n=1 Tax=Kitasatospora sp. NBC_01287 TaxID=2903573 RepID=UPI00225C391B|nr:DUF397 domain-containing protein [Kitasatospora sp. NBC_01287]MCX4748619.1 DUF397 domain-containing protein [Kitasatospora sp. NBC_01287]
MATRGNCRPWPSNAPWWRASYSAGTGDNCIEVADGFPGVTPVRDSKDPSGPALVFPAAAFAAFVADLRAGRLR